MEGCEMTEIVDGCVNSKVEIDSEEDQIMKKILFLTADTNVQNFGVSFGNSKTERSNLGTNSTYTISEYNKVSLKFKHLQPTDEFIKEVKDAINSKDPRKFKKIAEEFGQFVSKEVILGGSAYLKETNISKRK